MQSIDYDYQYSACFYLETDSFQYFICQCSDQKPGDDTGDQKSRCIVDQSGGHSDETCDDQLADVVGNTSGNTDAKETEAGKLLHKCHDGETECRACKTVENTEQISEHESDHDDTDDGNKRSLFPGIFFENEEDCQIGKTELHSGDSGKKRNQRFYISKDDGNCGKKAETGCFFLVHK